MSYADERALIERFATKYNKSGVRRHTKKRRVVSAYAAFIKGEVARLKARGVPAAARLSRAIATWRSKNE